MTNNPWALVAVALISALPAIIAAIRSNNAAQSSKKASDTSATTQQLVSDSAGKVQEVKDAVGETNGHSIADLARYQHERNHDIIQLIAALNARIDVIGRTVGAKMPPPPSPPPELPGDDDVTDAR